MIPIKLELAGFLSYRDPVEIDFTGFDLACIAGPNGAGKSSLLDAITWALFGRARKRDESVINMQSETAQVTFTFFYEGNTYRVQRVNPRGKSSMLEFHLHTPSGDWKPLTERTLRETDARLQRILRLDYDTFINASFFLQGKADQFTQQSPGERKQILSSILGLEIWETYRRRVWERRRTLEGEVDVLDGRLHEINNELAEEGARKERLQRLQEELVRQSEARVAQEATLESIRQIMANLREQRNLVENLGGQRDAAREALAAQETRMEARQAERQALAETASRAEEIEAAYGDWQEAREALARWEEIALRFHEQEKRRLEPLTEIESDRARLETELQGLAEEGARAKEIEEETPRVEAALAEAQEALEEVEAQLARRAEKEATLQEALKRQAEAQAENPRLRDEMNDLKERIDQLKKTEGATCPVCGQPLASDERVAMVESLEQRGAEMGDRYRENKALMEKANAQVRELEKEIADLSPVEARARTHTRAVDQFQDRLKSLRAERERWQETGAPRRDEIQDILQEEVYAPDARARLEKIDAELKEIGYDAAEHDAIRRAEASGRQAEADMRALEQARAALAPLEREIQELAEQVEKQRELVAGLDEQHTAAVETLAAAESEAPDLESAERELLRLQEEENRLRMEVGAAQQKVDVLGDLQDRKTALEEARGELIRQISHHKQLERAFGKDGVPALLIEQALPEIDSKANEILDRLSGGAMSVRFITQAEYKDHRRADLKETLDIQISDSAGTRDYEMFSGGEAFRVNFAIRLALSEVLAQRAGARLQTLVIDEGFGSQDLIGRQRLIEAINMVRDDFAKILVITHIDSLKEAFPTRIEVEKTPRGSDVTVI